MLEGSEVRGASDDPDNCDEGAYQYRSVVRSCLLRLVFTTDRSVYFERVYAIPHGGRYCRRRRDIDRNICKVVPRTRFPEFHTSTNSPRSQGSTRPTFILSFEPPAKLEEVENPPETVWTSLRFETPRALRLRSDYIKRNPQVWRTSTTAAHATRPDDEGVLALMLTRPDAA